MGNMIMGIIIAIPIGIGCVFIERWLSRPPRK